MAQPQCQPCISKKEEIPTASRIPPPRQTPSFLSHLKYGEKRLDEPIPFFPPKNQELGSSHLPSFLFLGKVLNASPSTRPLPNQSSTHREGGKATKKKVTKK
jgi:hypothetical protein